MKAFIPLMGVFFLASETAADIALYKYSADQLELQMVLCPEFGPDPLSGCDQCLPRSIPTDFQLAAFCGTPDDCPEEYWDYPDRCPYCNGICAGGFGKTDGDWHYVFLRGASSIIDPVLTGCSQFTYQTYCQDFITHAPIAGAYQRVFEFEVGVLPGNDWDEYESLEWDSIFWDAVASMGHLGSYEYEKELAWRQRCAAFGIVVESLSSPGRSRQAGAIDPGVIDWYKRAMILSLWLWVYDWEPNGLRPTDLGFPFDFPGDDPVVTRQLIELHDATCDDLFFDDCGLISIAPWSWGRIKASYR